LLEKIENFAQKAIFRSVSLFLDGIYTSGWSGSRTERNQVLVNFSGWDLTLVRI
jgi:hypothetical protein